MPGFSLASQFDSARLARNADALAAAVAVSLPWSTSATGILLVLWFIAVIPTLSLTDLRREVLTAAGGLPVVLVLLGIAGMAWADVSFVERWKGLNSFVKLLVIPLLLAQFRRSERADWVFGGYVLSCVVLLVASTLVQFVPGFSFIPMKWDHVLVKSAGTQSGELATCIFGLIFLAYDSVVRRQWATAGRTVGCDLGHVGQYRIRGNRSHRAGRHGGLAGFIRRQKAERARSLYFVCLRNRHRWRGLAIVALSALSR